MRGKIMKKVKAIIKAYAILNNRGGLLLDSSRLPIYWNSKVARANAIEWKKLRVANVEIHIIKLPKK